MWYSIPFVCVILAYVLCAKYNKNTFCSLWCKPAVFILLRLFGNSDNPWFNSSKAIFCKSTFCASVYILVVMILITHCTYEVSWYIICVSGVFIYTLHILLVLKRVYITLSHGFFEIVFFCARICVLSFLLLIIFT